MSDTRTLEIARRLVELGQKAGACKAYTLALRNGLEDDPRAELEAAAYLLQFGGDYKISYTSFLNLYNRGQFCEDILPLLINVFYLPNEQTMKKRYERNCKLLKKYPYLFRKDFLPFEELPLLFFPYDDGYGYTPFDPQERRFGEFIDFKKPVVSRNFFKNLENPVLADDVYSQYELEYLNDNIRPSEYVGYENHLYLHYSDWAVFCSYLQCLNLGPLLTDKKIVFLIEDEVEQYPIDFKERFGIDYSRETLRPVGIREVQRLIWHTQLSTHNGGDFFNEIFDGHPNLIVMPSLMLSNLEETIAELREAIEKAGSLAEAQQIYSSWSPRMAQELYLMKNRTDKDILVALFLHDERANCCMDPTSRIAPALFLQPHFPNVVYRLELDDCGRALLFSKGYNKIRASGIFKNFKYIKTFTPMRRITTSYGATGKFVMIGVENEPKKENGSYKIVDDLLFDRILNRSYMIDPDDRLYRDSVLVRFEDGKLNPTATFTALAAFLDLPYTESLTYCSEYGKRDVCTIEGNVVGFDLATVYRTYDDYANDAERCLIEYFMRDAYEFYGYDFHFYDGGPMDEERVKELIAGCTTVNSFIRQTFILVLREEVKEQNPTITDSEVINKLAECMLEDIMTNMDKERLRIAKILIDGLHFVNRSCQPLHMMPKLELDPALLEQPLYH